MMIGTIGILCFGLAVAGLVVAAIGVGVGIWQGVEAKNNADDIKAEQEKAFDAETRANGYAKNVQKAQQRKTYIRGMMTAGSNVQRAKLETQRTVAQTQALRADLNQSIDTQVVGRSSRSLGSPSVRS
ncbi:MAG: hypothetical protein HY465_01315 [Deltaproteobacteria bacterium]|nr:hypothetical protein [Deltaproteobacteria bacterium]